MIKKTSVILTAVLGLFIGACSDSTNKPAPVPAQTTAVAVAEPQNTPVVAASPVPKRIGKVVAKLMAMETKNEAPATASDKKLTDEQIAQIRAEAKAQVEAAAQAEARAQAEAKKAAAKAAVEHFQAIIKNKNLIPAGEVVIGSPEGEGGVDENPSHKVDLDAFYIDTHEVTVARYKDFAKATGREMSEQPRWSTDNHPVVSVKWKDADAYCKWAGGRLPTEAEWEKAARGGTNTKYSFGDDENELGDYAWYAKNSNKEAHPVGQKKPNQYGLYDMYGNVCEWVSDWYDAKYYGRSPVKDPEGPDSGTSQVLRGGSWSDRGSDLRAASRDWYGPGGWYDADFGFRCVVSAR